MSKLLKKAFPVFVALTTTMWLAGGVFFYAPSGAHGQTVEELQAQIQALLAQITALQAQLATLQGGAPPGGVPAACTGITSFDRNLSLGSTGSDVKCLQAMFNTSADTQLAASGVGSPGNETSYFGPLTKGAAVKFQEKFASEILAPLGLTAGTGFVGPSTRAKLNSLLTELGEQPVPPVEGEEPPVGEVPESGLLFTNQSDTDEGVLPLSATGVEFAVFDVTAGEEGTINSMTWLRVGVGDDSDFSNVYLYEGDNRLTTGKSVSADSQEVQFNNLGLDFSAGETRTFRLLADIAASGTASAGDVNAFKLTAVDATVDVDGIGFTGKAYSLASSSSGTLTIATSTTPSSPNIGQVQAEIQTLKLTASSTEDIVVKRLALTNAGSASLSGMSNFGLWRGADEVAAATVSGDVITFIFDSDGYEIQKGESKTFSVKADLSGSGTLKANETVELYLDETADLYGVGQSFGFGAGVTNNFASSNTSAVTIQAGDVTIAFNGPTAKDVQQGGEDVEVLNLSWTAEENVEVRQIKINVLAGTAADLDSTTETTDTYGGNLITDIKLIDVATGGAVAGPKDINNGSSPSAASTTITFTDRWQLTAGETRQIKVTADFADNTNLANDTYTFKLMAPSSTDYKSLDTGDFLATGSIVPSTTVSGKVMTVKAASLDLGVASTPVSDTFVTGAEKIPALGLTLTAGDASDVFVTSLQVSAYVDTTASGTFVKDTDGTVTAKNLVSNVYLYDGSTKIAGPKAIDGNGESTFGSGDILNGKITVPKGTTKTILVKADVSTTAPENGTLDRIKFDVTDASADLTVEDDDGDSVTATTDTPNGGTADSGVRLHITNAGTLKAFNDGSRPDAGLILSGSSNVLIGAWKFTADNEAFTVTKSEFDLGTVANDRSISSVSLTYPQEDGTTRTQTGVFENGSRTFSSMTFWVPKDDQAVVKMYVDVNTIASGAVSGDQLQVSFDSDANFEAFGNGSGTKKTDTDNSTEPASNSMVVRSAIPEITKVAASSTKLSNDTDFELFRWTVSNTSGSDNDDASVKKFTFTVRTLDQATSTALTIQTPKIYKSTNESTALGTTHAFFQSGSNTSTSLSITGATGNSTSVKLILVLSSEENISPGASKTFVLKADVSNAFNDGTSAAGDQVTVSLEAPDSDTGDQPATNKIASNTTDGIQITGETTTDVAGFIWSDNSSGSSHSDTIGTSSSADWTNGYLIKGLPSSSNTFTF
jgi:hypothetical protein